MKRLAFVLTAFLVQSCYTVFYTTSEYSDFVGVSPTYPGTQPVIVDRPHPPCAPAHVIMSEPALIQESQPVPSESSRPRTAGVTNSPAVNSTSGEATERVRTSSPQPTAVSPGAQSVTRQGGGTKRVRADSPQQDKTPRQWPQ